MSTIDIPEFNDTIEYVPPISSGIVIKVFDGDTITIAKQINTVWYRFSIRIRGIDCPEIRTRDEDEKTVAVIARDTLYTMLYGKTVQLKNIENDKYGGRYVADVYFEELNIGEFLLQKRLAVKYDGGKKNPPQNWYDYYTHDNNDNNNENED